MANAVHVRPEILVERRFGNERRFGGAGTQARVAVPMRAEALPAGTSSRYIAVEVRRQVYERAKGGTIWRCNSSMQPIRGVNPNDRHLRLAAVASTLAV